jgi:hypothetical protein
VLPFAIPAGHGGATIFAKMRPESILRRTFAPMNRLISALVALSLAALLGISATAASAQSSTYSSEELVSTGHRFFGGAAQGLASIVERAVSQYGLPNGYILGQEGSGAIIGGLRYGEGVLNTKNAGQRNVFWQGPSIGPDVGGTGDRVMMLVYNLPAVEALYQRYFGVAGSAHVMAGFGMTVLSRNGIYVVPIISGVGARLGVNLSYLKFTDRPTWNPF